MRVLQKWNFIPEFIERDVFRIIVPLIDGKFLGEALECSHEDMNK